MKRRSQQAVALVVTLILLSVITVVVVAYLALARRDRTAAVTADALTRAELMADAARERAIAEVAAHMLATTNLLEFDLMVSTNRDIVGLTVPAYTDLLRDPRAPVAMPRRGGGWDTNLYYLDLNRNGTNDAMDPWRDPEWIGATEKLREAHDSNNRFIGRYAYIVLPSGKSLDLNFIHNQLKLPRDLNMGVDQYLREDGFGSWELNLAGFLVDLNPNAWPVLPNPGGYFYTNSPQPSTGLAFEDALDLLRYRYDGTLLSLGPTSPQWEIDFNWPLGFTNYWPGDDNPRHYYRASEFFESPPRDYTNVASTLQWIQSPADAGTNEYNRSTLYRLLAQLGTDSVPERGKINLNYRDPEAPAPVPWNPADFFTNVVNRLLDEHRDRNGVPLFGVTGFPIPIHSPSDTNISYSPGLHRLLQLAANIYDATTNRTVPATTNYPFYPTVFRPQFAYDSVSGDLFITGYVEENGYGFINANPWRDLSDPADRPINPDDNVFGVPVIVGAKKGYPSFNQFVLLSAVEMQRKMAVFKPAPGAPPNRTNQWVRIGISNALGVEAWNSYATPYPPPGRMVSVLVHCELTTSLTNDLGITLPPQRFQTTYSTPIPPGAWPPKWFSSPLFPYFATNMVIFTNAVYRALYNNFSYPPTDPPVYDSSSGFETPQWTLNVTNRFFYFLIDNGRVVDAVSLADLGHSTNFTATFSRSVTGIEGVWNTNRVGGSVSPAVPTLGHVNQINVALYQASQASDWNQYGVGQPISNSREKKQLITRFRHFLNVAPYALWAGEGITTNYADSLSTSNQVPFTPTTKYYLVTSWEANDPLVHQHLEDLRDSGVNFTEGFEARPPIQPRSVTNSLGDLNRRYRPWGGERNAAGQVLDPNYVDELAIKDPLVRGSDDWEFPGQKFPNLGWLGRVHRGTPWQTVYLKSRVAEHVPQGWDPNAYYRSWLAQSIDPRTHPTNDWLLVDIFTVAQNANASRGQLSINQSGEAAWSAVLSSVETLSNRGLADDEANAIATWDPPLPPPAYARVLVEPASPELLGIVQAINDLRTTNTVRFPQRTFERLGDLLAVEELTVKSPFLNWQSAAQLRGGITDEAYERIPMKILSLLRVGEPRVTIYAYGQSLKPAPGAIETSGPELGVCKNYLITGEMATRTVVRFEPDLAITNRMVLRPVIESYNVLPPE